MQEEHPNNQVTAAFLIIGNEILSGRTQDKNLSTLALALESAGIRLCEVRVIKDDADIIIKTVQALSAGFDLVFTSGGIGPTHDDITAQSVADAFNTPLIYNDEALSRMEAHYKRQDREFTDNRKLMARIPKGARLIDNPVSIAPGFIIENVHVMAGVPAIFAAMVQMLIPDLKHGTPLSSFTITALVAESEIADQLRKVAEDFPMLEIGCYPTWSLGLPASTLVIRGEDKSLVDQAGIAVKAFLPSKPS